MLKRANKVISLLVATASIMSIVPAMAAERLGTKEGTIENAVAFKDGKYIYEGYRTDDDESGLYYNSGTKDKHLDDASTLGIKYGDKYVQAFDGSDEYIVDLSTGKISDEDTVKDLTDTAETKLITKLKKTDRYAQNSRSDFGKGGSFGEVKLGNKVNSNKFGDVWFEYSATTSQAITVAENYMNSQVTTPQAVYYGYTNNSGTYLDTSYNANIYAYNGTKMVKLKNVGDTEEGLTLNSVIPMATLGQDDKYIYRVVKANISGAVHKILKTSGPDSTTYNGLDYNPAGNTLYYIQRISKTQGDKEKDAYLPKTTDSYEISGATGNDDVKNAYIVIQKIISNSDNAVATIVDGAIYISYDSDGGDKVKTEKIVLKSSEKLNTYNNNIKLDTKIDGHVAKKDDDEDTDAKAWSIDVDGNVWAIYNGSIKKSTKLGDFKTIYTCDRSLDKLDVYDENNLIAWEDDGGAYTTVQEGKKQAVDDASTVVTPKPSKTGWDQLADGSWNFYDSTGTKVVNNWINVGGIWYYLNSSGAMTTGWQQINGAWYYLNPFSDGNKGAMKTGWINDNGTWYYLSSSGAMKTGWLNDKGTWYFLSSSGAMKTGWINDGGTWYFLYPNGAMAANTVINGYRLSSSGALA
nr:N-acetylmuramoyl-L-alanine amidase family protein [Clostridium chromiireducens]